MPNRLLVLALLALPLPALAETAQPSAQAPAPAGAAEVAAALESPQERVARKARKARKTMRAIETVGMVDPAGEGALPVGRGNIDALIAMHAKAQKIPEHLIHYVVKRESNYNPRAVGRGGVFGLMQIKHATARGVGYDGPASGLLDATTNLAYGVAYLAGAYRAANGNEAQAYRYFNQGYYYAAKRQGVTTAVAVLDVPVAPAAGGGFGGLIDKVFTRRPTATVATASADPEAPLPAASAPAAPAPTPALRGTVAADAPVEAAGSVASRAAPGIIDEASFKAIKTEAEMATVLAALAALPLPPRRPASLRLAAHKPVTSVPKTALATSGPVATTASP